MRTFLSHAQSVEAQYNAFTRAERMERFETVVTPSDKLEAASYAPPAITGRRVLNPDFNPNHSESESNPYWLWRAIA